MWDDYLDACQEVADYMDDNQSLVFLVSGLILGAGAIVMAVHDSKIADKKLAEKHEEEAEEEEELSKPMQVVTDVATAAPCYVGTAALAIAAGYCLWRSYDINIATIGTLGTALTLAERKNHEYDLYRETAKEIVGKSKEDKIRTETLKKEIKETQPPRDLIETSGDGKMNMYVIDTGTFIRSSPEDIRHAEKVIMNRLIYDSSASLYDLMYEADCVPKNRPMCWDVMGWSCGAFIEATFRPVLLEDGVTTITGVQFFEDGDDIRSRMIGMDNI